MDSTENSENYGKARIEVSGITIEWDLQHGTCSFEALPVAMMWVDTTLAGLMEGVQAMVGTERFALALQAEGRRSVESDWLVISQFSDFSDGFKAIANIAAVAGWGEWILVSIDHERRECCFRVKNSWEGRFQKSLGVSWGSGMLAGKLAGYASRLFSTSCWAEQSAYIANGDVYDEFRVKPSARTIEREIENLLTSDAATKADMAVALQRLQQEIGERMRAEAALRHSEFRYRTMADRLPLALQVFAPDGRVLRVNEAWERMWKTPFAALANYNVLQDRQLAALGILDLLTQAFCGQAVTFPLHEYDKAQAEDIPNNHGKLWIRAFAYPVKADNGEVLEVAVVQEDISAQKQAEDTLRRSQTFLNSIIENLPSMVFIKDAEELKFVRFNKAGEDLLGYSRQELLGKNDYDFFTREEADFFTGKDREVLNTGILLDIPEEPIKTRFQGERILHTKKIPLLDKDGKPEYLLGISMDITERKKAENALRNSEANFRTFVQSMSDIVVVATHEGSILFANDAFERLLGYRTDEQARMHLLDVHPADKRGEAAEILSAILSGERTTCSLPLITKSGDLLPVETCAWIGQWSGADCVFGLIKDLSAEQEAQQRFEKTFNTNPSPMALSLVDQRFSDVNEAWLKTLGYSREEVIGKTPAELGLFAKPERQKEAGRMLRETGRISDIEMQVRCKDGAILDGLFSGEIIGTQGKQYFLTVMINITKRKQAEDRLRESEARARALLAVLPDMMFRMNREGVFLDYKADDSQLYVGSGTTFIGKKTDEIFPPEFADRVNQMIQKTLQSGELTMFEYQLPIGGRELRHYEARMVICGKDEVTVIVRDITERKLAEEKLRINEEKYRGMFDESVAAIYIFDNDKRFIDSNQAGVDLLGYTREELLCMSIPDVDADPVAVLSAHQELLTGGKLINYEHRLKLKNGTIITVLNNSRPLTDSTGKVVGMLSTLIDISERKRAEEQLRKSEERLQFALSAARQSWFDAIVPTGEVSVGPDYARILGYEPEDFVTTIQNWFDNIHPDDISAVRRTFQQVLQTGGLGEAEYRRRTRSGEWKWMYTTGAVAERDAAGHPYRLTGIHMDISGRKRAEDVILRTHTQLQSILDNTSTVVFVKDLEGHYLTINRRFEELFNVSRQTIVGKTDYDYFPRAIADNVRQNDACAIQAGKPIEYEEEIPQHDGPHTYTSIKFPLVGVDGQPYAVCGMATDITERNRIDEARRKSEEKYRALVETTDTGYLILDYHGLVVDANTEYVRLTGHKQLNEILGRSVVEWTAPYEKKKNEDAVARCVRDRGIRNLEIDYLGPHGRIMPIEINATVQGEGTSLQIISLCRDNSDRKKGETLTQARLHLVEFSLLNTLDDLLEEVINEAEKLTGSCIGFFHFVDDNQRSLTLQNWSKRTKAEFCKAEGKGRHYDIEQAGVWVDCVYQRKPVIHNDYASLPHRKGMPKDHAGVVRELVVPVIRGEKTMAILGVGNKMTDYTDQDVKYVLELADHVWEMTERKRAEEALRESETRHRTIIQTAQDGFWLADSKGNLLEVNEAYCRMSGYSAQELQTMNFTDLEALESAADTAEHIQKIIQKFEDRFETRHRCKDGHLIDLEVSVQYRPQGKGYFICFLRDFTERKKLEEQLRQAQKMEAIGQLAGGVAHDFNNILTAIVGYGNIIKMKLASDDPQRLNIDHVLEAADRAAQLTHSLLAFSRKQVMNLMPIRPNAIITKIEKFLRRIIGEEIDLKTILKQDATILADSGQIEQVLMNLATNARDAMPKGGYLAIETDLAEVSEDTAAMFDIETPGSYVVISVTDSGIGMDEETKRRIFEPFFTTKEMGRGTGLGLSIVYGIIKQHKGHINLYSRIGAGTTFRIYLPAHHVSDEQQEVVKEPIALVGGTETVLLAEDDSDLLKFFSTILTGQGYKVITAKNGVEAVNLFSEQSNKIQLCILDMIMPKMSGKEAYEEIKKLQSDIKTIFISGYPADKIISEGIPEGCEYIHKPVSPQAFLNQIRDVLDNMIV